MKRAETTHLNSNSDRRSSRLYKAPGRVNLLGEHTDYTGGLVLPMAIPLYSTGIVKYASDNSYTFVSTLYGTKRTLGAGELSAPLGDWSDYPVAVFYQLLDSGIKIPPFELSLDGNIPQGAGLSSSASVEVVTAIALLRHAGADISLKELALLCQRAENAYVGSACGIMDQFAVAGAAAGHALLLDTGDLSHELLPMNRGQLADMRIVVVNSTVKHSIQAGQYGLRRRELEQGQEVLRNRFPALRNLGDANPEQLEAAHGEMSDNSYRRCRHVITENLRVRDARVAMYAGDPVALGTAISASHVSQRDDFECSCEEIDFLVSQASRLRGCLGARLTGGGFGGCTVNLVGADSVSEFIQELTSDYVERFDCKPLCYVCEPINGALQMNRLHNHTGAA